MLSINTESLDERLRPSPTSCLKLLHALLPSMYTAKNEDLLARINTANKRITDQPETVAEYTSLTTYFTELLTQLEQMEDDYLFLRDLYSLMQESDIQLNDEARTRSFMLSNQQNQFQESVALVEEMQEENNQRFKNVLLNMWKHSKT